MSVRLEGVETLKYRYVCHPCAEKFNIVSNNHGYMHKFDFSVFDQKHPFWANLVKKKKKPSKLSVSTKTNSNMQNSVEVFTFSV